MSPEPVTITPEKQAELLARLAELEAENASMKSTATAKISFKVGEKGGVSVYGLGRFPVTLYASQWDALLGKVEDLRAFIVAHKGELKAKANGNGK